jgi:predicted RNA-binding Zn ribbon-like protein
VPALRPPAPAPGEEQSISLALVNTELTSRGAAVDLLADGRALVRWLRARTLPAPAASAITDDDLARMRELRQAVRAVLVARVERTRPPRSALGALNDAVALAPAVPRLSWGAEGPRREVTWPLDAAPLDVASAAIATDAVTSVFGRTGERMRACRAHGCRRLFIQDHGRRQWCCSACGDRVRFARHYRRMHS